MVFTTHILHEADMLCDRIAVMHQGRLRALAPPTELKHRYAGAREVSMSFRQSLPVALTLELARALADRGASAPTTEADPVGSGSSVRFRVEHAEELLPWLTQWVQLHGLELSRLSVEEATLEGAFLGLIGDLPEPSELVADPTAPRGTA